MAQVCLNTFIHKLQASLYGTLYRKIIVTMKMRGGMQRSICSIREEMVNTR